PLLHLFFLQTPPPPKSTLFPYTTLFRSNNLRQIGFYVQFYTDENHDIFPAHRNQNENDNPTTALTNWWGTAVIGYARNQSNLFQDRKSTRLNSSHLVISYAVFCLKKKKK